MKNLSGNANCHMGDRLSANTGNSKRVKKVSTKRVDKRAIKNAITATQQALEVAKKSYKIYVDKSLGDMIVSLETSLNMLKEHSNT